VYNSKAHIDNDTVLLIDNNCYLKSDYRFYDDVNDLTESVKPDMVCPNVKQDIDSIDYWKEKIIGGLMETADINYEMEGIYGPAAD
jgi:hypothetical protein